MADETNCGVTANFALPLARAPDDEARWRRRIYTNRLVRSWLGARLGQRRGEAGRELVVFGPWVAVAAGRAGVGSTQRVSRCGIGVRQPWRRRAFLAMVLPGAKAGAFRRAAIRARFSWSASLVKPGFFVFVRRPSGGLACSLPESWPLRSAPPSARAHAAQFRANRHPAASADMPSVCAWI